MSWDNICIRMNFLKVFFQWLYCYFSKVKHEVRIYQHIRDTRSIIERLSRWKANTQDSQFNLVSSQLKFIFISFKIFDFIKTCFLFHLLQVHQLNKNILKFYIKNSSQIMIRWTRVVSLIKQKGQRFIILGGHKFWNEYYFFFIFNLTILFY